jgi:hypothetical protein
VVPVHRDVADVGPGGEDAHLQGTFAPLIFTTSPSLA